MEYPYFTATPQPYQFLGHPPAQAHTGPVTSDEYNNSPTVRDLYNTAQSFSHPFLTLTQDAFEFQDFDAFNLHFTTNSDLPKPLTPISQHETSVKDSANSHTFEINVGDANDDSIRRGSNSDDEEDRTPVRARRKAQNRAA